MKYKIKELVRRDMYGNYVEMVHRYIILKKKFLFWHRHRSDSNVVVYFATKEEAAKYLKELIKPIPKGEEYIV